MLTVKLGKDERAVGEQKEEEVPRSELRHMSECVTYLERKKNERKDIYSQIRPFNGLVKDI